MDVMWSHRASSELLNFAAEWLDKWTPYLENDKANKLTHYIGDTSSDARCAAELMFAFMTILHGDAVSEMFRNGNAREFMEKPEILWDLLNLPPEEEEL